MKKIFLLLMAAACMAIACNNDKQPDSVKTAEKQNDSRDSLTATKTGNNTDSLDYDKDFMVKAASGGLLEVELGKLTQQNASDAAVKQYGQMMVADHTKANNELTALAKQKNIVVPSAPGKEAQDHIQKLEQEKGNDFDKDYVSLMVDDHKEDVDEFQKAADKAKDPDIKALAAKTLPVLKHHLQMIQAIKDGMK